jgi:hypothetical protein
MVTELAKASRIRCGRLRSKGKEIAYGRGRLPKAKAHGSMRIG